MRGTGLPRKTRPCTTKRRTTMNDFLLLALALVAGLLLGAIFFGGLWWTVRKGVSGKSRALWFPVSMLLRMSIVLVGFYFVGREDWERLVSDRTAFGGRCARAFLANRGRCGFPSACCCG